MTAATTTAPERLAALSEKLRSQEPIVFRSDIADEVDAIRTDLCRAPVARDAEPVAWMVEGYGPADNRAFADHYSRKTGKRVEPLYAHPAPQPSDEAATLRAQLAEAINQISDLSTKLGRAQGKLEASELPGIVDGWKARAEAAEAALAAADDHADLQHQVLIGAAEFAHGLTLSSETQIAEWAHTLEDVCRTALSAHQARRAGE